MKIAIATSSVICNFDNDGSVAYCKQRIFNSTLRDEYLIGMCSKCFPRISCIIEAWIRAWIHLLPPREWQTLQGKCEMLDVIEERMKHLTILQWAWLKPRNTPSRCTSTIRCPRTWWAHSLWCTKSLHYLSDCKDRNYNWTNWIILHLLGLCTHFVLGNSVKKFLLTVSS